MVDSTTITDKVSFEDSSFANSSIPSEFVSSFSSPLRGGVLGIFISLIKLVSLVLLMDRIVFSGSGRRCF